eukprot:GEMP01024771.1.p1 GENE.GEMP01024771.1~~GEMP01024771.1.p1  ORF type:complete len:327 (+),score=104.44 GEMP01024771.1:298-1278(+)
MAASIPIAQPSLRQRAKTELIILPKANKRGSAPAFLQAMQLPMSQPSSKGSSHQPLSNQVSLSLFGDTAEETEEVRQRSEPRLPRPRSPGDSRRRLEKTCPEEDSLNLPIMAQMLIDRERAEKHKLQAEAKEQVRLHDFDKIMMMSQFQEERDVMRDQKEQLVAKLRNSHIYERSLIKDIKGIVGERDMLKKEVEVYKQRERIAASNVGSRELSPRQIPNPNRSAPHIAARRGHGVPSKRHRSGLSSAQECYTRHIKAYAESLRQQQQQQQKQPQQPQKPQQQQLQQQHELQELQQQQLQQELQQDLQQELQHELQQQLELQQQER